MREMVIAGLGIELRSTWDIGDGLRSGELVRVLPQYRGASDVGLTAVMPARRWPARPALFVGYLRPAFLRLATAWDEEYRLRPGRRC